MASEEVAAADALARENAALRARLADLSRQIGEQNTTIGYQDAMLGAAYHALQSYAHGNSAPDLAREVAAQIARQAEDCEERMSSEEIALADAMLKDNAELRAALDVALKESAAEHDLVKALLIRMRRYIIRHDLAMGECVAWNELKRKFCVGQSSNTADEQWLWEYERRKASEP